MVTQPETIERDAARQCSDRLDVARWKAKYFFPTS
jgi:hypothetical protein